MSANQRRSGFRLPWLTETDEPGEGKAPTDAAATPPSSPVADAAGGTDAEAATETAQGNEAGLVGGAAAAGATVSPAEPPATNGTGGVEQTAAAEPAAATPPSPQPSAHPSGAEPPSGFIRDLVAAMRAVADEARTTGVEKLKATADEAVQALEADAEKRREELRERAEADITGVGEWARAEVERVKAEADQRVASRRTQLEQQLAAEGTRTEAEAKALRARVDDYERELEAFHAQLAEIGDPAAFAAAAKRMPAPPDLTSRSAAVAPAPPATPPHAAGQEPVAAPGEPPREPASTDAGPAQPPVPEVHPAEEEVLAARLAELDAELESPGASAVEGGAPVTTDIVVKGLGSFGAITGFRQSLSAQPGIDGVALSLGQNGEFVFRATHAQGFDLAGVITSMEGDGASVEPRPEGGLRVTLERSR
jgi:hypothetical protein